MAKQLLKILSVFIPLLLFVRCAQVGQLTGGKKDEAPPVLLEAIPANQSANFKSSEIVLRFDEFVQIKDLSSQLVVSPKIKTAPEVVASGKKINITLNSAQLSPNTTYRFYFGQAIADINENNVISGFEYVFSTGPYIDTLKLSGIVSDSYNNKPAGSTIIGLYNSERTGDSLPYKEVPDYLSKTNEQGQFSFSNMPPNSFKVYAFTDKNKNYLYDGETEKVAFLDKELKLSVDSAIRFNLFQEEASKGFIKKTLLPYYGFMQIILNKKSLVAVEPLNVRDKENLFETLPNTEKDTVTVYYKSVTDTIRLIFKNISQGKSDTLKLALPKKTAQNKKFKGYGLNVTANILPLGTKPLFSFANWMDILTADAIRIHIRSKEDSLISTQAVKGKWLDITHYEIDNDLKEGVDYTIKVDTNAFFDINGISNDSSAFSFKTQSRIEFGKLTLKLLFNQKQSYIVQLLNEKEMVVRESFINFPLSASNAASIDFIDVQPGTYSVKIIFDTNGNKKWDTGNLISRKQPERVLIHPKQIKVLSDWELEEEIVIKE